MLLRFLLQISLPTVFTTTIPRKRSSSLERSSWNARLREAEHSEERGEKASVLEELKAKNKQGASGIYRGTACENEINLLLKRIVYLAIVPRKE